MTLDAARMAALLGPWAEHVYGSGARVDDVAPMPGNAGLSFGFRVRADDDVHRRVIRLAPPGVRRRGNTDVLRQVPLLDALAREGVPVAPVLWSTDDPAWFGTDAVVQPYLDARPVPMHGPPNPGGEEALRAAVHALAALHAVDWATTLPHWEQPRPVADEVAFWDRLLERADPAWAEAGRRLGAALVTSDPGGHRVGIFHGDYQTHNVLYDDAGGLVAIIDWEIAGIGPVGLDLGWLAMMVDLDCWHAERRAVLATPCDPTLLRGWYEEAIGAPVPAFDWYRALACYRYGAIAAFNLYLHTSGKRPDEVSVLMGRGVPSLFAQGRALVE